MSSLRSRIEYPLNLVCASGLIAVAACTPPQDVDRPNVLVISIDTLRSDHLAAYGYPRETAPALTRLAAQGVVFANSYSQAPSTSPTHASMFTGKLPFSHGVFSYQQRLADRETTLAEHVQGHGYATFAVVSSIRFVRDAGMAQGFDSYYTLHDLPKNERSARAVELTLQALAENAQLPQASARPLFAFVHLFDPHEPYAPPEPYRSSFHPGLDAPIPEETSRFIQAHNLPNSPVSDEVLDYLSGLYDGAILYADGHLDRLLSGLDRLSLTDDTIVIVTSDHGEEFKEHRGLSHSKRLYEEVLRVPLILRWPGRIPSGTTVQRLAQSVDLLPTICDLLDIPTPGGVAGRSFVDDFDGAAGTATSERNPPRLREVVIVQQDEELWGVAATLPTGRFKLIQKEGTSSLYRLDSDPGELDDVGTSYQHEAAVLRDLFEAARAQGRGALDTQRTSIGSDELERLRDLGYLGSSEP